MSEDVHELIRSSSNRPITEMNFIEFFNPSEPDTSCMFQMLFLYRATDRDYQIFKSFAESFLAPLGFEVSRIKQPEILREYKHIDLLVKEDSKYAVIFDAIIGRHRWRHLSTFQIQVESLAVLLQFSVNISIVNHFIIITTLLSFTSMVFICSLTSFSILLTNARSLDERKILSQSVQFEVTDFSHSLTLVLNRS